MKFQRILIIASCVLLSNVLGSLGSSCGYKAAVVEFAPKSYLVGTPMGNVSKQTAQQNMMLNLNSLEELVQTASIQGAQIIPFPEDGVTGRIFCINCKQIVRAYAEDIPDVAAGSVINPCSDSEFDDRPVLKRLSCIARHYSIVLVANIPDEKGDLLFSANVVFEVDGTLIAKYYKQHLFSYESSYFDIPTSNRYITFTTSFDVEFSVFICYDVLFCDPPLEMVNRGIKNFIYSTYWGNRYPHYMSTSVRQGWSWRNRVNVLSSGIHNYFEGVILGKLQKFYSSGSGVYSAGKPLGYYISGENFSEPSGRLIIADVPLEPGNVDTISCGQRLQLTDSKSRDTPLNYQILNSTRGSQAVTFESKNFRNLTCIIEYEFSYLAEGEVFAIAASIFPDAKDQALTYALCSLSRRPQSGETPESIGYNAASRFRYLRLSGSFLQYPKITVLPMVLGDKMRLLDPSLFILEKGSLTLQNTEQNILVANLWGKIAGGNDGYCSDNSYGEVLQENL